MEAEVRYYADSRKLSWTGKPATGELRSCGPVVVDFNADGNVVGTNTASYRQLEQVSTKSR